MKCWASEPPKNNGTEAKEKLKHLPNLFLKFVFEHVFLTCPFDPELLCFNVKCSICLVPVSTRYIAFLHLDLVLTNHFKVNLWVYLANIFLCSILCGWAFGPIVMYYPLGTTHLP